MYYIIHKLQITKNWVFVNYESKKLTTTVKINDRMFDFSLV